MADASVSFWTKYGTNILLGLGISGIIGMGIYVGLSPANKDNANEIRVQLGIITGVTVGLCFLFGIIAYMYFTSYPAYLTNFILIMTFINLAMSIFATGAATLNISNL
jgi:hypothetical protein